MATDLLCGRMNVSQHDAGIDGDRVSNGIDLADPFIRVNDRTTALPDASGVAPPDMLVLPPCGTIGVPVSRQTARMAATSAAEPGRTTAWAEPWYFPSQSLTYGVIDAPSVRTFLSPTMAASLLMSPVIGLTRRMNGRPSPDAPGQPPW